MEKQVMLQVGENAKNGIYEVFVNHQDYFDYFGLGESKTPNMMQKMYAVVWNGQVEHISLEERRAWAEFKGIAEEEGVEIEL